MKDIVHTFSAEKKLHLSLRLYYDARKLKHAAMKKIYPEKSEKEISEMVKKVFQNAGS